MWKVDFCGWEPTNEDWGIVLSGPDGGEIFQPLPESDCRALACEGIPFHEKA
jgi:2-succinyl-5-enolpyruvyl-6-hydroxy-3-cyclohexene-1-carboxylate synthase